MSNTRLMAALTFAAAVCAAPVIAHHSVGAEFDWSKKFSFEGAVIKLTATNPHSYLEVERTNPDGTKTVWKLQSVGIGQWRQRFGPEGTVKPGMVVKVEGLEARSGKPYGFIETLTLPNGRAVKLYFGDPNGN